MKMKITILMILVASLSSCIISLDSITGSGNVVSEVRNLNYDGVISSVEQNTLCDVTIAIGSAETMVIEAEQNLIPYIQTSVSGGKLVISTRNNKQLIPTKPIRATVILKQINGIVLNGSGDINASDINDSSVQVQLNGSGNIKLSGYSDYLTTKLCGSGNIDAKDLISSYVTAETTGSGNTKVYASKTLNAAISGSGDIIYYYNFFSGSPYVVETKTGSGRVLIGF